jgi:hypothetical protein
LGFLQQEDLLFGIALYIVSILELLVIPRFFLSEVQTCIVPEYPEPIESHFVFGVFTIDLSSLFRE